MSITVFAKGNNYFTVSIKEPDGKTEHEVTLSDDYHQQLTQSSISKSECVKKAFVFLLEHESKEMILNKFDLSLICQYFSHFKDWMQKECYVK